MKRFLFFICFFLFLGNSLQAQWPPNFTVTDLEGNNHTLYDYLGTDKTVILHVMSTAENDYYEFADWDYVQSGVLDSVYAQYGPDGTDEVMVFMIEIDSLTNDDCLYDLPTCNQANDGGDWVSSVNYPIIGGEDGSSLSDIFYYDNFIGEPSIYFVFPDLSVVEEWGFYEVESFSWYLEDVPTGLVGENNVGVSNLLNSSPLFCSETILLYEVQNWGTTELTSFDVELRVDGNLVQSFTWSGNLAPYEKADLTFDPIVGFGEMQVEISVSVPNGNTDANNQDNVKQNTVVGPHNTLYNDFNMVLTNLYSWEFTVIQILDPNGDIVYEEEVNNSTYSTVINFNDLDLVLDGCYELQVFDPTGYGAVDGEIIINDDGIVIWNDWIADGFSMPFYNSFNYDYGATAIAFLDENENGIFDEGETPLSNQSFSIDASNEISFTNAEGLTTFILEENTNYVLTWEESALWNSAIGTSVSFTTTGADTEQIFYFPFTSETDVILQELDLSSSITRCSEDINYWLTYSNTGTSFTDGYIQLIPDELTTFLNATPAPDSTAGDTLYWFYEGLAPSNSEQIAMQFLMPGVAEFGAEIIGEMIDFESNIETWEGNGDRKAVWSSELVCSYDPNDKLVFPNGYGGEEKNYALFEDSLEYTVRFQNTGNATAYTVRITDEIDVNLDLNTFRVISSSHEVETNIDTETRIATFLFDDIYLADSFSNEPASHGFIKYRILTNEGLSEETEINNTANIFFDFNPAVVTNTISSTMVSELPSLPVISASPQELDFGFIAVGDVGHEVLIVQNPGDLDLVVSQILSESSIFNPEISEFHVPGGGEVAINVNFTPAENIPYASNLVLSSNAGDLVIAVKGEGGTDSGINAVDWRLSIAPNPSNGLFELTWDDTNALQNGVLTIFNVNGQSVLSEEMNGNQTQIDLSAQAKGVYFLRLQTDNSIITKKLIVQ